MKNKAFSAVLAALILSTFFAGISEAQVRLRWRSATVKADHSMATDQTNAIEVDCSAGAVLVTLPPASAGRFVYILKIDSTANAVTIAGAAGQTINGSSTDTLTSQYHSAYIAADGAGKWYITKSSQTTTGGVTCSTLHATGALTLDAATTATGALYANGGLDRSSAAALTIGAANANAVTITPATTITGAVTHSSTLAQVGAETVTGALYANGGIDRSTAAALAIGATNATSVVITPATTVAGALYPNAGIDRSTAAGLTIGAANATSVTITPATTITGALTCSSTLGSGAIVSTAGVTGTMFTSTAQTVTVADSGNGSAATGTITPTSSVVIVVCNDSDGCTMTMGEGSAATGQRVTIVNTSANTANFADSSGVSELAGAFAMGQYDTLSIVYAGSTWIETGRSNN